MILKPQNFGLNFIGGIFCRPPLFLLILFLLQSCAPDKGDDVRHPLFIKALNAKKDASFQATEKYLSEYLLLKPLSAKGHLELAYLYQENLHDPLKAIYHYRRCMEIYPDSSDIEEIKSLIKASEKKIMEKAGIQWTDKTVSDTTRMKNEIRRLRSLNDALKMENEYLKKISGISISLQEGKKSLPTGRASEGATALQPDTKQIRDSRKHPDSYIVEPSDSLSKISRKIYGNARYYGLIFQANKDVLATEETPLMIGQELIIPKID